LAIQAAANFTAARLMVGSVARKRRLVQNESGDRSISGAERSRERVRISGSDFTGVAMPRLCFIALLLLTSEVAKAAAESSVQAAVHGEPCVASLPRAQAGTYGGYCYETVVANSSNTSASLPLVIGLHWSGSTPSEFREVLTHIKNPARLVLVRGTQVRRPGFSFYPVEPYYYVSPPR